MDSLSESQAIQAKLLDQMFDAAINGDFKLVRKLAKEIHRRAKDDKLKIN